MSFCRSISWTAALRDLRADRAQITFDQRRARLRCETFIKIAVDRARLAIRASPLVVIGHYDRRAIMCTALATARARQTVTGDLWRLCLSAALKGTWQVAKAARFSAMFNQQDVNPETPEPLQRSVGTRQDREISQRRNSSRETLPSQPPCSLSHLPHGRPTPPLTRALDGTLPVSC